MGDGAYYTDRSFAKRPDCIFRRRGEILEWKPRAAGEKVQIIFFDAAVKSRRAVLPNERVDFDYSTHDSRWKDVTLRRSLTVFGRCRVEVKPCKNDEVIAVEATLDLNTDGRAVFRIRGHDVGARASALALERVSVPEHELHDDVVLRAGGRHMRVAPRLRPAVPALLSQKSLCCGLKS